MPRTGLWSAAAVLLAACPAAAADPVTTVDAMPGLEYAVDPATGGLAAVVPRENKVLLYPKFVANAGKKPDPIAVKVDGFPAGVVFKRFGDRAYFAVVTHLGKELVLLDPATLKAEKPIPLGSGRPVEVLTSADPKDPFVYYLARAKDTQRMEEYTRLGWVDLTPGAVESSKAGIACIEATPAADGTRVFFRRGPSEPEFGVLDAPRSDRPGQLPAVKSRAGVGGFRAVDPWGEYVAGGDRVWSSRDRKEVVKLGFDAWFASPTVPVLLGLSPDRKRLFAVSTNTWAALGAVDLPFGYGEAQPVKTVEVRDDGLTSAGPRIQILEDPTTRTFLVASGARVRLVPFAALKVPDEPPLAVKFGGPLEYTAGRPGKVAVTPAAGVTVELAAGPEGMTLDGGALVWNPGEAAVGMHPVTLKLSAKGVARSATFTARARRPSWTMPPGPPPETDDPSLQIPRWYFSAGTFSPDGSAAVFVTRAEGAAVPPPGKAPPSRVRVLDLDTWEVTADRTLPVGVRAAAAVDGRHVYAALTESDAVRVLARKDLSDVGVLYTAGRPAAVAATTGGPVLVASWKKAVPDDHWRTDAFDPVGLKPAAAPLPAADVPGRRPDPPVWAAGGWLAGGVLYDAALGKPRAVLAPRDFWEWSPARKGLARPDPPADGWFAPWGVFFRNGRLVSGGEPLKSVGYPAVVLPDRPAVACLTVSRQPGRAGAPVVRAEVTFRDLEAGKAGPAVVLSEEPFDPDPHAPSLASIPAGLYLRPGGGLVAVVGREWFTLAVPKLDPEKFPVPFHVRPDSPVAVVSADEVSVPLPAAAGGKPPYTFALAAEVPGVRVDAKAGKLVVSPKEFPAALTELAVRKSGGIDDYLAAVGPRFERLTGKKPAGAPVWVPVPLVARDKLLGKAEVEVGFFADVPLK